MRSSRMYSVGTYNVGFEGLDRYLHYPVEQYSPGETWRELYIIPERDSGGTSQQRPISAEIPSPGGSNGETDGRPEGEC